MLSSLQVYNDVDALDGNLDVDDDDNDEVQGVDWVWYAQPPSSNLAGRVVVTSQWQCISSAPISFALFALWGSLHLLFALWGSSQLVHWNSDAHWNTAGALAKWGTLGEAPCTLHFVLCTEKSALYTLHFALCSALVAGESRISHSGDCLHFFEGWRLSALFEFAYLSMVEWNTLHSSCLCLYFNFCDLRKIHTQHFTGIDTT